VRIPWAQLGLAAATIAAATFLRAWLDPFLGDRLPFVLHFVAIVLIAWRTNTSIALASVVACWLLVVYLFMPPRLALDITVDSTQRGIGSLAFLVAASCIVFIAHYMRRAQRLARQSEQHLELIGNRVPALISYIGADRCYRTCNEEYTRWYGVPRERIIGRPVREFLGEDAWKIVGPRIDAAFAGEAVEYESEIRYRDGGKRWIHASYTPHRAADGSVVGIVALVTDITERKRAEQHAALLADVGIRFSLHGSAEDNMRAVSKRLVDHLDLSRCLLAEVGEDGETVRVLHDYSTDGNSSEASSYRVADFLTAEERGLLAEGGTLVVNDVRAGRSAEAAARFEALGVGAVVSAPYFSNGKRKFTLAAEKRVPYVWKADEIELLREVSARLYLQLDRARSERTLRESEQRYRSLVSVITDIPNTVDADARFVERQDAWSRYTGQTWEEYRDYGWLDAVHPDDRESARRAWKDARSERALFEVRGRIWHAATREHRHVIARATPVFNDDGSLREWVGACTDIHDDMMATDALIEADRRKDEFLATLAHELRNPLAPIRNSLHILRLTGKAEGALAGVQQMLERQVNLLVRLVDDLMEVSRITRGRVEIRTESVDIASVIRSAVETSRPLIDEAGHALEVSLPTEPLTLEADPVRIAQVISNLLNNAAKYTDRGGRIRLSAWREGASAVISVRDNGRGIPATVLPKVFDLFSQADQAYNRTQSGLGIGLTLVKGLVRLHDGAVEAHSDGPGRGSEFIVRLPLPASQPATGDGGHPHADLPAVPARRILVVDDNHDAAESLGILLTLLGVETQTAHDGRSALEALDTFAPSVMLLDLGMPGMDGYEVAERTRQHPNGRKITIIALTGWGQERDRRRSQEAGIDHHLVKPVDLDALRKLLASLPQLAASRSILSA
jgi:PAS domain S-box-containing protein